MAGFVLSAPDYSGTPAGSGASISWAYMVTDITVAGVAIHIATGYQHWVNIGGTVYSYVQQDNDGVGNVATALANAINGSANALATATVSAGTLTLAPRENTGAAIEVTASPSAAPNNIEQTLFELTGNELVPSITRGVLFAQAEMYRPAVAPVLPAAPAGGQSWLYYNSGTGWYWSGSPAPNAADDACVGWVATSTTAVIAISSRKIGTGEEAAIMPGGPVAMQIGGAGDTDVPAAPSFEAAETDTQLVLGDLTLASADNSSGIDYAEFVLYYVDEAAGTSLTLTADLTAAELALSASGALPAAVPGSVTFTFYATTQGTITIGPGYVHSIGIGATTYTYAQQTEDTPETIAQALADVINADADPDALAMAVGATVVLTAAQNTGAGVTCSASDGNTPRTLTETMPSYVAIDQEIIAVHAADGSAIARAQKGSTAAAHASGAKIWPVATETMVFAVPPLTYGTPAWPTVLGQIPFQGRALVAADCWVSNEIGPSPVTTECFSGQGPFAVDSQGVPLAPDVAAFTAAVTTNIQVGGLPYYRFGGTVKTNLAVGNTAEIDVVMTDGSGVATTVYKFLGPFTANTVLTWQSVVYPQPTSGPVLTFGARPVPLNPDLAPTVSAFGVAGLTVPNGTSSVSGSALPAQQPASVTLTESGPRTVDAATRSPRTTLTATVEEAIVAPDGQQLGVFLHLQLSTDGGATWGDLGVFPSDRTDEDGTHTYFVSALEIPDVWVLSTAQQCKARVWAATESYDPGPAAAVTSAAYALAAYTLPAATDVVAVTVAAAYSETNTVAFPYNVVGSDGTQYWNIIQITYDDTGCLLDVNAFFVRVTVQYLDATKTAIGPEMPFDGTQVIGGVYVCQPLIGAYGPTGADGYPMTSVAYIRLKFDVCNRENQTSTSFQDPLCATLQTGYTVPLVGAPGQIYQGPGYVDVMVAQGGGTPAGQVDLRRANSKTVKSGLKVGQDGLQIAYGANLGDDGSGNAVAKLASPLTTLNNLIAIANQGLTQQYLANAAVGANQMAAAAVTQANQALAANAVVDANVYSVGVSKLIAGTVIFTGDAVFSRGTGYPVMDLSYNGLFLYSAAASGGGSGLTSYPYIAVQSGGLGLYSGGQASATLSSYVFYLWSVSGNASYPYMSVTSSGATIAAGSFSTVISASQITQTYSGGASMTLSSAQLKILNGTYSIVVGAGFVQIWSVDGNNAYPCLGITSGLLTFQAGNYSMTCTASSLTLAYTGGTQVQLTSSTVTVQANSSNYVQISSGGTISIVAGGYGTTISGNNFGTGFISCASLGITPGSLVLGIGSGSYYGGTIVWPWQQVSGTASAGYITPPTIQGFLTIYINNGTSNVQYKLAYYNV